MELSFLSTQLTVFFAALMALEAVTENSAPIVVSFVDSLVTLPCNPAVKQPKVDWRYQRRPTVVEDTLSHDGVVVPKYTDTYQLNSSADDSQNLIIHRARMNISGQYTCVEDAGNGNAHRFQLVVFASKPECFEDCLNHTDVFDVRCDVVYSGNCHPIFECHRRGKTATSTRLINDQSSYNASYRMTVDVSTPDDVENYTCSMSFDCLGLPSINLSSQYQFTRYFRLPVSSMGDAQVVQTVSSSQLIVILITLVCVLSVALLVSVLVACRIWWRKRQGKPDRHIDANAEPSEYDIPLHMRSTSLGATSPSVDMETTYHNENSLDEGRPLTSTYKPGRRRRAYNVRRNPSNLQPLECEDDVRGNPIPQPSGETKKGHPVRAVCIIEDKLYVTREDMSYIEIYNKTTMEYIGCTRVEGKESARPGTMAPDVAAKMLYILYIEEMTVVAMKFDVVISHKEWSTVTVPEGISVTPSSGVLVTLSQAHQIVEFTPDGRVIKNIKLYPKIRYPRYAIVFHTNNYLISYGVEGSRRGLCIASGRGELIKAVNLSSEHPLHLAVGGGYAFVADYKNNKLLVLNDSLVTIATIQKGVNKPFTSYFDDIDGEEALYVGEWSDLRTTDCRVMKIRMVYGENH